MSDQQDEPKIVVDEDWKARVRAEREAAKAARKGQAAEPESPADEVEHAAEHAAHGRIPPASFPLLVSTLAAQALTAMGRLPDPVEGHPVVRPDLAKHHIDMLGILEEKTRGNLSPEDTEMLEAVLHELRMAFVTTRRPETSAPQN